MHSLSEDEVRFILWLMGQAWEGRLFNNPELGAAALMLQRKLQTKDKETTRDARGVEASK